MPSIGKLLPLRLRAWLRHPRIRGIVVLTVWSLVAAYFLLAALILTTRWYLLPHVADFKDDIARAIGDATGTEVTIGAVEPSWEKFWPQLHLEDVLLKKADARHDKDEVLEIGEVNATLYWYSVFGTPAFYNLSVKNVDLTVRRTGKSAYEVGGFGFDLAAGEKTEKDRENPVIAWLLKQRRINISDSTLRLIDLTNDTPAESRFTDLNLTFERRLTEWIFGAQAVQETNAKNPVDIRARFETSLFSPSADWRTWKGEAYAATPNFDFARFARGTLLAPVVEEGTGSLRLWVGLDEGKLTSATADVGVSRARLKFAPQLQPMVIDDLSARLTQSYDGKDLTVKAANLTYTNAFRRRIGPTDLEATIALTADGINTERVTVAASVIELEPLLQMLPRLPVPRPLAQLIIKHRPSGHLTQSVIVWDGPLDNPHDWRFSTHFENLRIASGLYGPGGKKKEGVGFGFSRVSGQADISQKGGEMRLTSTNPRLVLPGVYADPVFEFDKLTGTVSWRGADTAGTSGTPLPFELTLKDVRAENADLAVTASGTWHDTGEAGTAALSGTIERMKAERAWRYMPLAVGEATAKWLQAGLVGGTAKNGKWELTGALNDYPWTAPGTKGKFLIEGNVENGAVDYVPNYVKTADGRFETGSEWPILSDIQGTIRFEGASMTVVADASRTMGVPIEHATARIPDLAAGNDVLLEVRGHAKADLGAMLGYVSASPVRGYLKDSFEGSQGSGTAALELTLDIPLLHARDTKVKGIVTLEENVLAMPWPVPPVTDLTGRVTFTEKGAWAERVTAKAFSRDATLNMHTEEDGTISLAFSGLAQPRSVSYFNNNPILAEALTHVKGETSYVGAVSISPATGVSVSVQSDLKGVSTDLPSPLNKSAGSVWPLTFAFSNAGSGKTARHRIAVNVARNRFSGIVEVPAEGSRVSPRGSFAVGRRTYLPRSGFALEITGKTLDADRWQTAGEALIAAAKKLAVTGDTEGGATLERVSVDLEELKYSGMNLGAVEARADLMSGSEWRVRVGGTNADGTVTIDTEGAGRLHADFKKLHLPAYDRSGIQTILTGNGRRLMPEADIDVEDLRYGEMILGKASVKANIEKKADGERVWRLSSLTIANSGGTLTGQGEWHEKGGKNTHSLHADLKVHDAGVLLTELGYPNVLQKGNGEASVSLTWDGTPWSPVVSTIEGPVKVSLANGSFQQVNTGVGGAVLSLLSMQSLLKRLQLDFSDLVQNGFSFDTLTSESKVVKGVAYTDGTKVIGSHASIISSGKADFNTRTIDYDVLVLPDINAAGASIALAVVNPVAGIGSLVAQLLLRNPLSKIFSTEYKVQGSFDNPTIEKKSAASKTLEAAEK